MASTSCSKRTSISIVKGSNVNSNKNFMLKKSPSNSASLRGVPTIEAMFAKKGARLQKNCVQSSKVKCETACSPLSSLSSESFTRQLSDNTFEIIENCQEHECMDDMPVLERQDSTHSTQNEPISSSFSPVKRIKVEEIDEKKIEPLQYDIFTSDAIVKQESNASVNVEKDRHSSECNRSALRTELSETWREVESDDALDNVNQHRPNFCLDFDRLDDHVSDENVLNEDRKLFVKQQSNTDAYYAADNCLESSIPELSQPNFHLDNCSQYDDYDAQYDDVNNLKRIKREHCSTVKEEQHLNYSSSDTKSMSHIQVVNPARSFQRPHVKQETSRPEVLHTVASDPFLQRTIGLQECLITSTNLSSMQSKPNSPETFHSPHANQVTDSCLNDQHMQHLPNTLAPIQFVSHVYPRYDIISFGSVGDATQHDIQRNYKMAHIGSRMPPPMSRPIKIPGPALHGTKPPISTFNYSMSDSQQSMKTHAEKTAVNDSEKHSQAMRLSSSAASTNYTIDNSEIDKIIDDTEAKQAHESELIPPKLQLGFRRISELRTSGELPNVYSQVLQQKIPQKKINQSTRRSGDLTATNAGQTVSSSLSTIKRLDDTVKSKKGRSKQQQVVNKNGALNLPTDAELRSHNGKPVNGSWFYQNGIKVFKVNGKVYKGKASYQAYLKVRAASGKGPPKKRSKILKGGKRKKSDDTEKTELSASKGQKSSNKKSSNKKPSLFLNRTLNKSKNKSAALPSTRDEYGSEAEWEPTDNFNSSSDPDSDFNDL